ncbi:DUF559 domain-containing protein [bacterium]|nr:MAG: DUF559 domain-containing protein [bacterium]
MIAKNKHIIYKPSIKFARQNRKIMNKYEVFVWVALKILNKKYRYGFSRQICFGPYILDFYSKKLKTNIEVDGETHEFRGNEDIIRDEYVKRYGIKIIRITNSDVLKSYSFLDEYLNQIIVNSTNLSVPQSETPFLKGKE